MKSSFRPAISVIIPTYNPRFDLLRWTLDSLRRQTLPTVEFEIILVDNCSHPPVDATAFSGEEFSMLRVIREAKPGIVNARLAGIAEAVSGLLVFVDDDNALDPDYLEQALRIASEEPSIGCFGGIARAVFEGPPAASWKQSLLGYLGVRDYGPEPITSWKNHWGEWEPIGAGMACRRAVAEAFREWMRCAPLAVRLGRRGGDWMSGDDTLMAMSAYKLGYACSYQPALKLSHWIKPARLRVLTLIRLLMGHGRSFAVLQRLKEMPAASGSRREWGRILWRKYRLHVAEEGYRTGTLKWFWDLGYQLEANRREFSMEERAWREAWFADIEGEIEKRDNRILALTHAAARRLEALNEVSLEAERRAYGKRQADSVAQERLDLLAKADSALKEMTVEAERREQEARQLRTAAQERLQLLERADAALRDITAEAERRERMIFELTAAIEERDRRIAELERLVEENLAASRHPPADH